MGKSKRDIEKAARAAKEKRTRRVRNEEKEDADKKTNRMVTAKAMIKGALDSPLKPNKSKSKVQVKQEPISDDEEIKDVEKSDDGQNESDDDSNCKKSARKNGRANQTETPKKKAKFERKVWGDRGSVLLNSGSKAAKKMKPHLNSSGHPCGTFSHYSEYSAKDPLRTGQFHTEEYFMKPITEMVDEGTHNFSKNTGVLGVARRRNDNGSIKRTKQGTGFPWKVLIGQSQEGEDWTVDELKTMQSAIVKEWNKHGVNKDVFDYYSHIQGGGKSQRRNRKQLWTSSLSPMM